MEADIYDFIGEKNKKLAGELSGLRADLARSIKQCVSQAKKSEDAQRQVDTLFQNFRRDCLDRFDSLCRSVKTELKTQAENTIAELDEIIVRFTDDEEASKDYTNSCRAELLKFNDLSLEDMFASNGEDSGGEGEADWLTKTLFGIGTAVNFLYNVGTLGLWGKFNNWLQWKGEKKEILETPENELVPEIDSQAALTPLKALVEEFVAFFNDQFQKGLIDEILAQVEKAKSEFASREENRKKAAEQLAKTQAEKKLLEEQAAKANRIVEGL
jgi:hypothetical protein